MKRIFAIMSDGRVLVPTDVYTTTFGEIKFTLEGQQYRYAKSEEEIGWDRHPIQVRLNRYFTVWKNGDWLYTNDIAFLYEIKPEEDEELNYFESTDFNAGVIYGKVDKAIGAALKDDTLYEVEGFVTLPIIQMFPKVMLPTLDETDIINATFKSVIAHFDAVFGKNFTLSICNNARDKQYINFKFTIARKNVYKEMTVEEIEKELGYKIKVVGEK